MRQRNLSRVLHTLAAEGPLSRADVAARIGLTRAAVSTLVEELLRGGLLVERGPGRSGAVGRPGTQLLPADRGPAGMGAEIGVDHLAVCVMDLRGEVRVRIGQESGNQGSEPAAVLGALDAMLRRATSEAAAVGLRPVGLTVAVPGLVLRDSATVLRAPNLGWSGIDLAPLLPAGPAAGGTAAGNAMPYAAGKAVENAAGDAAGKGAGGAVGFVAVENEANLGALAELWSAAHPPGGPATPGGPAAAGGPAGPDGPADGLADGPADGLADSAADSFVYVSAAIGIGAAVVVDGELLRGAHGFAGELGHMPVRPGGRPCSCGGRGCLEAYAGEEAVLRAAGLTPGPGVRLGALTVRCEAGEPAALRAVREAGTALGIALSGAVNLLDPRRVVIGGPLARLGPWLLPPVRRELARRTAVAAGGRSTPVPVTASPLGPDGPLLGAARSAVRAALDSPGTLLAR
ncbi:ROK family transcriptional regulator [Streptomyces hoynatensis]|uniref:ROK family transcriptional regulator n=1 Tax=Streptomyces hoynatensis TaxID=1141874 RepID=A0A3A9YCV5_9ACTN|nr:ROK family transcriptional regulator [Streptomyces hoynatensis]RKN35060.1 ROK family transcriptional regulator [Streptomyces hoynatensis]